MVGEFEVREATPDDAEQVARHMGVVNSERLAWFNGPTSISADEIRPALVESLETPISTVKVVEDDGEIVGVGFIMRRGEVHGDANLSVAQSMRGRGLGRRLLGELVAWARREPGLERLYAKVFETNPASLRMCEALGFAEDMERAPRYEEGVRVVQLFLDV